MRGTVNANRSTHARILKFRGPVPLTRASFMLLGGS
jgi:hypothetical protein